MRLPPMWIAKPKTQSTNKTTMTVQIIPAMTISLLNPVVYYIVLPIRGLF
jgi:hypothetical protein